MYRRIVAGAAVALLLSAARAAELIVPNGSFEDGATTPTGWRISGGVGAWEKEGHSGSRSISVTGDGAGSNYWMCPGVVLATGKIHKIEFWTKSSPDVSGEFVISGTNACNCDWDVKSPEWTTRTTIALIPPIQPEKQFIRFGHWHAKGKVWFDDVSVAEVKAEFAKQGQLALGGGEAIIGGRYQFVAPLKEGTNVSRVLREPSPGFDSDRWRLSGDVRLTFLHTVSSPEGKPCRLSNAVVKASVIHHRSGACAIVATRDGKQWANVGEIVKDGAMEFRLPPAVDGAEGIEVRLIPKKRDGDTRAPALEVNGYEFSAGLDGNPPDMKGETKFVPASM